MSERGIDPGLLGLLVQAVGIALIGGLCALLARSHDRSYLRYWAGGWLSLAAGLFLLFFRFRLYGEARHELGGAILEAGYTFGGYAFGLLLVAGCASVTKSQLAGEEIARLPIKRLLAGAPLALVVGQLDEQFDGRFLFQATMLGALFWIALFSLRPWRPGAPFGVRVLGAALAALGVHFLVYVPLIALEMYGIDLPVLYGSYASLLNLVLETMLGFGMVILAMEDARLEVEAANRELHVAKDRLEELARVDPLTDSLNRHAFYSLVEDERRPEAVRAGCVAVVDVDGLKRINDSFGHASGDAVIRAVSRAIRELVRADDLVFRWGGDEFLVVVFGMGVDGVRPRLEGLDARLERIEVPGSREPLRASVSFGIAAFDGQEGLERAIEAADQAMYRRKRGRHKDAV
jgi:diguanylate cyclase (GGDEF)-like protein